MSRHWIEIHSGPGLAATMMVPPSLASVPSGISKIANPVRTQPAIHVDIRFIGPMAILRPVNRSKNRLGAAGPKLSALCDHPRRSYSNSWCHSWTGVNFARSNKFSREWRVKWKRWRGTSRCSHFRPKTRACRPPASGTATISTPPGEIRSRAWHRVARGSCMCSRECHRVMQSKGATSPKSESSGRTSSPAARAVVGFISVPTTDQPFAFAASKKEPSPHPISSNRFPALLRVSFCSIRIRRLVQKVFVIPCRRP